MAAPSRRTALVPSSFTGGFGGGRGRRATSAVGEPGKGRRRAEPGAPRQRTASRPAAPPPSRRRPRRDGGTARSASLRRRCRLAASIRCSCWGATACCARCASAMARKPAPRCPFLPPSTKPSSLILVDGLVYATTSNGCGATPNAVWALDLDAPRTGIRSCGRRAARAWPARPVSRSGPTARSMSPLARAHRRARAHPPTARPPSVCRTPSSRSIGAPCS